MKKKILVIFSILFICLLSLSSAYAKNIDLKDMNITATLNEDGSAHIKEVWDIDVNEGTEIYKVFDNMGDSKIKNFKVVDEKGYRYHNIGAWDIDVDKEDKDGKCGLVIDGDRYEMCFGIGEYGKRVYTFEYDITNFIQQYQNDQGFNYAFFSELSLEPRYVKITISSSHQFNEDNANIWAFGYYGNVLFKDGKVVMETTESVPEGAKMQLLMRIDNGTFKTAHENNQDFDDILEDAKNGSNYDDGEYSQNGYYNSFTYEDDSTSIFFGFIAIVIGVSGLSVLVAYAANRGTVKFQFNDHQPLQDDPKQINMFRDIPCHGDMFEFYYLAKKLGLINDDNRSGLIAAIILRWIQKGYIEFEKEEITHMFVFKKEGYSIDLKHDIPLEQPLEKRMLSFFKKAAGDNQILETKEFERWCSKHYKDIDEWFESIDSYMQDNYQKNDLYHIENTYTTFMGMKFRHDTDTYDVSIREKMEHILGFKYFLEEMSLINEKEVIEVKMWEEYLIFASILGIADKVQEELGRLCPTFNEQSALDTYFTMRMVHIFAQNSMFASQTAAQQSRSGGFGGSSSFGGGGGGFSGGGGGGVR